MTVDPRILQVRAFFEREEYAKAYVLVSELLNENPDEPQCLYLAGCILRAQGHVGMALPLYRRALGIEQKQPNLWLHYGASLHDTHNYEDARAAFRNVAKMLPRDAMPVANIAATYVQEGKARQALEWADKALDMPDNDHALHIARIAKAYGALGMGRWQEGWQYAEALYGEAVTIRYYTEAHEPLWDGSAGKTVVVQADQGLGDVIMFAQCLRDMAADCKKVIVETDPRLVNLLARNFPDIDVYGTIRETGITWPKQYSIDARIHISYLGRFYRTKDGDFTRTPYLAADEARRAKWRQWLDQFASPRVGIAWLGGIPRTNTRARSIQLASLAPILSKGGTFISLAYQDVGKDIARWNVSGGPQVIVPRLDENDYDDTVALLAELDHVVTVTTTIAHVCGALGRQAAVMVNKAPAWRYVYDCGEGMIWYPPDSVHLYRQVASEADWTGVISRIAKSYSASVLSSAQLDSKTQKKAA